MPPTNYVSVTTEFFADQFYMPPYAFTLVAGAVDSPVDFTLRVYSTDRNMRVSKI